MGADKVTDRKHSIRKKYSLEPEQEIHNGWNTQDVECSEHKQIFMDVDIVCKNVFDQRRNCLVFDSANRLEFGERVIVSTKGNFRVFT